MFSFTGVLSRLVTEPVESSQLNTWETRMLSRGGRRCVQPVPAAVV